MALLVSGCASATPVAALARMRRVTGGTLPTVVGVLQLRVPADEAPEMAPFEVPVALNSDEGNAWEKGVSVPRAIGLVHAGGHAVVW